MKFTDIFINKPVLAVVVSLFILLFGLRAYSELNVRQYPELRNAVVNVSIVSDAPTSIASVTLSGVHSRHGVQAKAGTLTRVESGWRGVVHFDRPGIWNIELVALVDGAEAQIDTTLELSAQ